MNKGNETWINNGVAIAVMSSGEYVQYDPKHIAFFKDKTLFLSSIQIGKTGKRLAYVCFNYNGMKCRLHRWVIGAKEGQIVDHKDRDPLNNILSNLRIVTFQENMQNKNHYVTTSTGLRGVYSQGKKFRAASKMNNKNFSLGTFQTKEEAARAYDAFVVSKLGDKAVTNARLGLLPHVETLSRLSSGETKPAVCSHCKGEKYEPDAGQSYNCHRCNGSGINPSNNSSSEQEDQIKLADVDNDEILKLHMEMLSKASVPNSSALCIPDINDPVYLRRVLVQYAKENKGLHNEIVSVRSYLIDIYGKYGLGILTGKEETGNLVQKVVSFLKDSPWISVEDRLPGKLRNLHVSKVVCATDGKRWERGAYNHRLKYWTCSIDATHWRDVDLELPSPPESLTDKTE